MKDPGAYDTAELISAAVNTLRDDPALLAAERARRRRIFVDEYQDTDPGQARAAAAARRRRRRTRPRRRPRPVDLRVPRRRPVGDAFGRRAVRRRRRSRCRWSRWTAAAAPAPSCSPRPAGSPRGCPGAPSSERSPPPAGCRRAAPTRAVFRTASEEAAYIAGTLRAAHLDGTAVGPRWRCSSARRPATLGILRRAMITRGRAGHGARRRPAGRRAARRRAAAHAARVRRRPARLDEDVAERLLVGPLGGGDALYLRRLRRELRRTYPGRGGPARPGCPRRLGARVLPRPTRPAGRCAWRGCSRAGTCRAGRRRQHRGGAVGAVGRVARWRTRWERASLAGGTIGSAADRDLDAVLAAVRHRGRLHRPAARRGAAAVPRPRARPADPRRHVRTARARSRPPSRS